jgi:hypothetical protein
MLKSDKKSDLKDIRDVGNDTDYEVNEKNRKQAVRKFGESKGNA